MRNIYRSLLLMLATATHKELARYVAYLKAENKILRSRLPARVPLEPVERSRLVRLGAKLGKALHELVTIVHPDTLRRWIREDNRGKKRPRVRPGRRRTGEEIRRLILKLAKANNWGYTRILGELRKLNIRAVSRNTVKNILKEHGYDPGPQRGHGTWDEFLKIHAATLWQCDFVSKRIVTPKGIRDAFLLVFLHVQTRRVFISPATRHPNSAWVKEQAAAFLQHAKRSRLGTEVVLHDRDTKFVRSFDAALEDEGLQVKWTAYRSPNTCAFVERFIQTLGQECLDHFIVLGQRHLDYLVAEFLEHYHLERPHQSLDNYVVLQRGYRRKTTDLATTLSLRDIGCKSRLGGLLKHYYRRAA